MTANTHLWLLVGGAIAGTYFWRFFGTLFSRQISTDSAVFQWITCVSYAMLAGLISRMVLLPVGPLIEVSLGIRLVGIAVGLGVFFLLDRRVLLAVGSGLAIFIALVSYW